MGVVWSACEKEILSWLQSIGAFAFPHRQRLRWLHRGQVLMLNVKAVKFSRDGREAETRTTVPASGCLLS